MKALKFYVKTCNISKIKYFGKFTGSYTDFMDVHYYKGSGVDWVKIIKQNGYKNVTTELVAVFDEDDVEMIKSFGENFSAKYDIVKSKKWANKVPENGLGGTGGVVGSKRTEKTKIKMSIAQKKNPSKPMLGKKHSAKTKQQMSISAKLNPPTYGRLGIPTTEKVKVKISNTLKNKPMVECNKCGNKFKQPGLPTHKKYCKGTNNA